MNRPDTPHSVPLEVLAVEDSPTQRERLTCILQQHGYRVATAANGAEALALLRTTQPAIVLSDIVMPEMDGYELCRRIKADPKTSHLPVILLTALSDPRDIIQGLESGADNFIVKPFEQDHLLSRLDYIIANRRLPGPDGPEKGVEILFAGQKYVITSHRRQILDLLLSTYEAAVRKNAELIQVQDRLKAVNTELERKVQERTARLEQANKSLESFCYTIAHDLRAPLRAIQGFASMLLSDYADAYDDTGRDYAHRVINAAARMDQLIQDLLAFGRITQAEFPLATVSLESTLEALLQQFAQEIQARKAVVQVQHPLPHVRANATVLDQVLTNLLSNALKFSKDNVPPQVCIWAEDQAQAVRLSVRDNGIGIDPQYTERIFHIFERLHDSRKYPGTGIGLVIVRKGVERLGGRVGLQSRPGQGSTFWIELPPATSDA